eukprot:scaffold8178_cov49-Attheya_sp.AAC.2
MGLVPPSSLISQAGERINKQRNDDVPDRNHTQDFPGVLRLAHSNYLHDGLASDRTKGILSPNHSGHSGMVCGNIQGSVHGSRLAAVVSFFDFMRVIGSSPLLLCVRICSMDSWKHQWIGVVSIRLHDLWCTYINDSHPDPSDNCFQSRNKYSGNGHTLWILFTLSDTSTVAYHRCSQF